MTAPLTDEPEPIDLALSDAEILTDTYDDYDTDVALQRVTALASRTTVGETVTPALPMRYHTTREQAAHDLDLAVALIVDSPRAHVSLAGLIDHDRIEPEGALVFAALLHLAGHREQAQFWFEFAAGAGTRTAAFCLFLIHQQRAEYRDAKHWRAQGRQLPPPRRPVACTAARRPLLAQEVRDDLISRCQQGRKLALPPRLAALIHSLPVDGVDADFGEIPRPDDTLTSNLSQTVRRRP
ncbi:glycoprotein [Streptomyces sp. NPDC005899]|uniref:glycoprotein n=1 Tax=Streptomyces sp. NPDC005899 TaxID=3155716 RepID=UPI0033DE07B5